MIYLYIFAALILIGAVLYLIPLFHTTKPTLPVLLFGPVGISIPNAPASAQGFSVSRLEKLLILLQKKQFSPVLPTQITDEAALPQKPILLLFSGGFQTIFTDVFPLLQKYQFKAAVALPVSCIGQYDIWNTKGPWQNILTASQLKTLQQSGLIEFISQGLDNTSLHTLPAEIAAWQLQESKTRLHNLYHLDVKAVLVPGQTVLNADLLAAARQEYPLILDRKTGSNLLPLQAQTPLTVFPVSKHSHLHRLCWRLTRP